MTNFLDWISGLFKPNKPLPAGLYHYQSPADAELQYRMHLRVDQEGNGLLIINASTILHLNQTATEFIYHLMQQTSVEETARIISSRYQTSPDEARRDYLDVKGKILALLEIPDLDPVSFLDFSREDPYGEALTAPYRLDCALTYRLPDRVNPQVAPIKRVTRELDTDEWYRIIDRAWEAGIPHLIFTGGEPTLREDLVQLIQKAEANGQVTGLMSDGMRLVEDGFRKEILLSGLDHLLFLLSDQVADSWKALSAILAEDLHTTVHITINTANLAALPELISRCKDLGANAISLSISDAGNDALLEALAQGRTLVAEADLPLKWDLPVPYSAHNPITQELEGSQKESSGAGKAWFYVEPDGDVLPGQGINQVLGNMLDDDWQRPWRSVGGENQE